MSPKPVFTLAEARALVPWLHEASAEAVTAVRSVQQTEEDLEAAQARIHGIIHHWAETVFKLGGRPSEPFSVVLDNGTDHFSWAFPEEDIYYRSDDRRGSTGRQRISEES
jgi:hypothetical protein